MLQAHFWLLRIKHHQKAGLSDTPLSVENEIFPVVWAQGQLHTAWNLPKDEDSRVDLLCLFLFLPLGELRARKGWERTD